MVDKELEQKIAQLQLMQQRVQVFSSQKQQFQIQLMEVENALKEVSSTKKPVFKLIGGILIEKPVTGVKNDLTKLRKDLKLRISSIEKQEENTQSQVTKLQTLLSKEMMTKEK